VPLPGTLDKSLGEFWVNSPWQIATDNRNLSAFERNRAFLNVKGENFLDISQLTGADSDGDGRAVVAVDLRNVGMLDLIVRQAGGGPLKVYENRLPRRGYLEVTLRGQVSNRQGIGARLTAMVNGKQLVREMFPANSYLSQSPNIVHFGLAESDRVEKLTIRWPSGKVQELKNIKGNCHIVVDENRDGADAIETVTPGRPIAP
jgi:hypothetical protein